MAPAGLDLAFDALASAPRREIVARLAQGPTMTPELGREFDFSKQALSRHVAVLEQAGLVRREIRGRVHELSLAPRALEPVSEWLEVRRAAWESSLDRLDDVLRSQE